MDDVWLELGHRSAHGGTGKGKPEFGVKREGVAFDSNDARLSEVTDTPLRREDQHLVAHVVELPNGLAERGDNAVDFRNEGFGEERDSHEACQGLFFRIATETITTM